MARYLVTGAAGFIAANVTAQLLAAGHDVVGLDNLNDAYDPRLKHWRLNRLKGKSGFTFQQGDITDRAAVNALFAPGAGGPPFAAVLNLAARAGVRQSTENPWVYIDTNVTGTLNLLEAARSSGVPKFVLSSTSSLYGAHNARPFQEDADTSRPLSPYAASKKAAEALCYSYHHLYGLDVTVLRYFTVYGPAGRPDMSLFRFVQWISEGQPVTIFGDGRQERDFTYVEDIARGTIAALRPVGYATVNLGSDQPLVLLETVRLIERLVDRPANLVFKPKHPADVDATWADIRRARELLDWSPQTGAAAGIAALVDWYQAERSWAREIKTD